MLELDLLLGNFLEEAYPALSEEEQGVFIRLLDENDPDLFSWLTGKRVHENPEVNNMIEKIRYHAEHRH